MTRVLVTGASGFIGSQVVRQLAGRGYEVHAVGRAAGPAGGRSAAAPVRWHGFDMLSGDHAAACALLSSIRAPLWIHLAWCTEPGSYWRSPDNFRWVTATLAWLRAFREQGGERVVVAGTCAEYDAGGGWCRESSTPLRPATPYGLAKHALQTLLDAFSQTDGLSWAWGRIFYLYGPGERPERLVPAVIRGLLAGRAVPCTSGEQIRDYLHVEDVAAAFVTLLESAHPGPANVASGQPLRLKDLIHRIAAQIGRPELIRLGELPVPANEVPYLAGDAAVLRGLQWRPRFDLDSGIAQTIGWWRGAAA